MLAGYHQQFSAASAVGVLRLKHENGAVMRYTVLGIRDKCIVSDLPQGQQYVNSQ